MGNETRGTAEKSRNKYLILNWSKLAKQEKDQIVEYISNDNPLAAVRVGDIIENKVMLLAVHPQMGRIGRVRGTRELVIQETPYIAVYKISGKNIYILRILHGAQNWSHQLN